MKKTISIYLMRLGSVLVFSALFTLRVSASPVTMIPPGDSVLDDLRFVMRESGLSLLSLTPPLSGDEIRLLLDEIDESALSLPAQEAYRRIGEALKGQTRYQKGPMSLDARVKTALEGQYRSNSGIDWNRTSQDSESLLSFPLSFYFADILQIYFEPVLRTDPAFFENGSHWTTNVPYEAQRFDLNMPFRTFGALGGSWWNVQLGRDKLSFGPGKTGNMAVSDTPDFYDFARVSLFLPDVKYSFLLSQLPLDTGNIFKQGFDPNDPEQLRNTTNRYMYLHRIDVRLFKRLSLGLSEGIMVGNSPVELRFMNPLMVFHSFFAWNDYPHWTTGTGYQGDMTGSLLSVDLEWAVIPSLALYGQFVMNEFSTPYELKNFPDSIPPNGLGYLAGIEYTRALGSWGASFYEEFVYTDPYLYTLSSPFASFISMRRLSDVGSKDPLRYWWIGHPAGRDALLAALGASFFREPFLFSADISMIRRGEHSILWDWAKSPETVAETSPSGSPETQYTAVLEARWQALPMLRLSLHIAGMMVFDAGHEMGSKEFGVESSLRVTFSY